MQTSQPYEKIAFIYDQLMSHVNYKNWADYVINLFHFADIKIQSIIDISCGTGSLFLNINQKKFTVFGTDFSHPMLQQARKKSNEKMFFVNDVRNCALKSNQFDAVLFLYDSLNYMQNENDIEHLFREVNRILVTGGIFIFDIITDLLCRTHYKNFEEEENWGNNGYVRHSFYDSFNKIQHNDFRITIDGKNYLENHVQKIFSGNQINEAIKRNEFKLKAKLDDFTFHHSNKDSERIHYVCLKNKNHD